MSEFLCFYVGDKYRSQSLKELQLIDNSSMNVNDIINFVIIVDKQYFKISSHYA